MYRMGLGYALNCVQRMIEIFSRGRESEVEAVLLLSLSKNEKGKGDLFKKVVQKMEEAGECSYPL